MGTHASLSNLKETQKEVTAICGRDIMLDPNRASDKFPYLTIHVCTLPCEKKTKYTDFFTDPQKNVVTSKKAARGTFFLTLIVLTTILLSSKNFLKLEIFLRSYGVPLLS